VKKITFLSLLMSIALGSLMLTSCNIDSCGSALADLTIIVNKAEGQCTTVQTAYFYSKVSNIQDKCISNPSAGISTPSESRIILEKYDNGQQKYVYVGEVSISDPALLPNESNESIIPITFSSPGLYQIKAATDVSFKVSESDESNNGLGIKIGKKAAFQVIGEEITNAPIIQIGQISSKLIKE